jgi:hypothetical protein
LPNHYIDCVRMTWRRLLHWCQFHWLEVWCVALLQMTNRGPILQTFIQVKMRALRCINLSPAWFVQGHPVSCTSSLAACIPIHRRCHIPYIRASHPKFQISDLIWSDPQIRTGSIIISFFIHILFI